LNAWWKSLEKQPKKAWLFSAVGLIFISWVAFLYKLGSIGLIDKTEALYVEIAHQIVLTNNWINPQWNGDYFYSYPIGGSWFMALSFELFGVSEWAARFPVTLSAIAVVILSFYTLRYFGNMDKKKVKKQRQLWTTAWIGSGIVALNPAWVAFGRIGVSDMFLSSGISLAMLAFFLGYAQPEKEKIQQRWYIAFPIFMAIAVLVKGPIGIILPVLGIGCFLIYVGKFWQVLAEIRPIRTIIIFLALTLPWYITASIVDENFVKEFLGFSNFQRFTNVLYNHPGPWYFYIICITVLMLPWSVYFPLAIARLRIGQLAKARFSPRHSHLGIFAFFWFITIFLFFSAAATKLPGYILPLIPAVAMIISLFWGEEMSKHKPEGNKSWFFMISAIVNIIILIALAVASAMSANLAGGDPSSPNLESSLRGSGLPLRLTIIWGLAALMSIFFLSKKQLWRWLWSPNLFGFLAFITLIFPPLIPLLDAERQQPFRQLSVLIKDEVKPEEEVFLMGFTRYSVVYYSQHEVEFFDNLEEARNYLKDSNFPKSKSPTVLILSEPKLLDNFELNNQDFQLISEKGAYQLIRISKDALLQE
jgi:4-amino-4-deoxy-L-arabinose transferase-like glycosyltransferase